MWDIMLLWFWYAFPWWIVRLSIFLYTLWLFVYFLWRNICSSLFSLFHFSNTMTLTWALAGRLSFWTAGTGTGEPGGLPSMRSHRVGHDWVTSLSRIYIYIYACVCICWRRKWQPTPVLFPGEPLGQRSLVCYSPWGRRVGQDWATDTHTHTHVHMYI